MDRIARGAAAIVLSASLFMLPTLGVAAIPKSERELLIALYASTGGAHWKHRDGWCTSACDTAQAVFDPPGTECKWHGVRCDAKSGHVTELQLHDNGLSGTLPSLEPLPRLEEFSVSTNDIGGPLPSLHGLSALSLFFARHNKFSGPLPSLEGLRSLTVFEVSNNQLSGSLFAFPPLPALEKLDLSHNRFSGALPSLQTLPNLEEFSATDNQFSGAIPALQGMANLKSFAVASNHLSGNLPAITGLLALRALYVYGNQLDGSLPEPPPSLVPGRSALCPNRFDIRPGAWDERWNRAAGVNPWWGERYLRSGNVSNCEHSPPAS